MKTQSLPRFSKKASIEATSRYQKTNGINFPPPLKIALLVFCFLIIGARVNWAQAIDTLTFGNATSESNHSLTTAFPVTTGSLISPLPSNPSSTGPSDTVTGTFGLSARRLLPRTPNADIYGGEMTFTMAVDSVNQNYLTIKLWGADSMTQRLILNCNGFEVGWRRGGNDQGVLWDSASGVWFPSRFIYRTVPLPLQLTRGQTSVTIKIRSTGMIAPYATGGYTDYQKLMNAATPGVYEACTHTGSYFAASGETQGNAPTPLTPLTTPTASTTITNWKNGVNSKVNSLLSGSASALNANNIDFLAQSYGVTWTTGYNSSALINQLIAGVDAMVAAYSASPSTYISSQGWGGTFGPVGDAIRLVWPQLQNQMSTVVSYGGSIGTVTRQSGWSQALRASVDYGRYNRRGIAVQDLLWSFSIYSANRGLELVDPSNALNESEALRYLYESAGLSPWLGSDQTGGGPVPVRGTAPNGPNWYMITSKGTLRDPGFTGADYGEQGGYVYRTGVIANDSALKAQGLKILRARAKFRFPTVDSNGYQEMQFPEFIGCRNSDMPGHVLYLGRTMIDGAFGGWDDLLVASQGASSVGSDLVGFFQQHVAHGQYMPIVAGATNTVAYAPYFPDYYNAAAAQGSTGVVLPMTSGQPDFAWVDEENMVVAAKCGEERLFAVLDWHDSDQPGGPIAVNGLAKIFNLTSQTARVAEVATDDVQLVPTGSWVTRGSSVDVNYTPPDAPINANNNKRFPVAMRSDLATPPNNNTDASRGCAYTLRYGHWLVAINAHRSNNYTVQLPTGFTSGTNLVTGQVLSGPMVLSPTTSAVFYLASTSDSNPRPVAPLFITNKPGNGLVTLGWDPAGGASSYNIKRSITSGSGYQLIATGVTTNSYTDSTVSNGSTYYYVVSAVNSNGEGGNSPQTAASPNAPMSAGVVAPWTDADIGSVGLTGSASITSGTFVVVGSGADIWGTSDAFHYLYQPMVATSGTMIAHLSSQTNSDGWAKAGIMMRTSLSPSAQFVNMVISRSNGTALQYRTSSGGGAGSSSVIGGVAAPYWVRLVRNGATYTGSVSPDGVTWTQVGQVSIGGLADTVYIGLISCAHNNSVVGTAVYDNVSFPALASSAPMTPSGLTATSGVAQVTLTWSAASGATGYNIKRSTANGGPYTTISSGITGTSLTDTSVTSGVTYYYVVSTTNSTGESPNSAQASAMPTPNSPTALSATAANMEIDLAWTAPVGATSYNIKRSTTNGGPYTTVATGVTTTSYADTGLVNGTSYYYVVSAQNSGGEGSNSSQVSAIPAANPVANSWLSTDIGNVGVPGGASYTSGTFNVQGAGADIWGSSDAFQYVYQTLSGTGAIIARMATQSGGKSGVMIRQSLASNSAFVDLVLQQNFGSAMFQYRSTTGGGTANGPSASASTPCWLKLERAGSTFTSFVSSDGTTWTQVGQVNVSMTDPVYIGLAQCSFSQTSVASSNIDNVSIVPSAAWSTQDIGAPQIVGASYSSSGTTTMIGAGADVWGTSDQMRYTYLTTSNTNTSITVRVAGLQNTNVWAKAGVMIRNSLASNDQYAFALITPTTSNGASFQYRTSLGGAAAGDASATGIMPPYWLRVTRNGSTFSAYRSVDGANWVQLGASHTINMGSTVDIGIGVCSHTTPQVLCTGTLDNLMANP